MKTPLVADYLKCVYANKATFTGCVSLAISLALDLSITPEESPYLTAIDETASALASYLLGITWFGLDTFRTYRKSKEYIQQFGKIKESYNELKKEWYCSRVGIKLAAKEAGLESTLEEGETK